MNKAIENRALERLLKHAQLVQRLMLGCAKLLNMDLRMVMERALLHDSSKFSEEMYVGTIIYDIKDHGDRELSEIENKIIKDWTVIHYREERHHPGHFQDCNEMEGLDILEMVCDWTAMAVELKNPNLSAVWFADKVIGQRFLFNEVKVKQIYDFIGLADKVVQEEKLAGWFD